MFLLYYVYNIYSISLSQHVRKFLTVSSPCCYLKVLGLSRNNSERFLLFDIMRLLSLERRRLQVDCIATFQYVKEV